MNKVRRIYQSCILFVCLLGFSKINFAQTPISPVFFGQNAWMPDTIGDPNACTEPPCIFNGKLYQHWGDIKNSNPAVIRFGGSAVDRNMPTHYQYIRMIDAIRANGMEPIIQVPFHNWRYSAQQAADIVQYVNVTMGKNVKYWIIGNEPDLAYSFTTAAQIAAYIKPFASAMKSVDPNILIIGPECAWFNQNIISGLTNPGGPDDITGKDANGRYYLDVISFHTYPFNGTQSRAQVISKLSEAGSLNDHLVYLNGRVANCNTAHNRTGSFALKTAITEANIDYKNSSSDDLYGVGANSFIGGQFIAEMMGMAMKNGVDFMNFWSVVEGNNTELNIGYIDPFTNAKKPAYYHFKMMADNFKGTFANGTTNNANIKSFGSKDGSLINVMIMNEDASTNLNYTVRLNTSAVNGTSPVKININAGVATEYSDVIANQSTVLLTFNSSGVLIQKTEYTLGNAIANQAPVVTQINNTALTTGITNGVSVDNSPFDIKNVFPNPSNGKFTIEMNRANREDKSFEIEMYNLLGQQVYTRKFNFVSGKEEIELNPDVASGEYIVRIKESGKDNFLIRKLIVQK